MKYHTIIYDLDGIILNIFDKNIYPLMRIIQEELALEISIKKKILQLVYFLQYLVGG